MAKRHSLLKTGVAAAFVAAATLSSGQDHSSQERLVITETWISERVSGLVLSAVEGVAETSHGRIWISDPMTPAVYSIDPRRNTFTKVARDGEGPGEVEGSDRIAVMPDGNMAVFDYSKIEVYTAAGESVRRVRLAVEVAWPKGFAVLPTGGFVISGGVVSISAAIHHFDPDGWLVKSWEEQSSALGFRERIVGSGGPLYSTNTGLLYSQSAPHRIMQYDYAEGSWGVDPPRGRMLAELPDMLVHPGDGVIVESGSGEDWRRRFLPYFPQSRGVFQLTDGRILNVVVFKDDGYSVWQVFGSPEEGLVAQGRVDEAYVPWFLCEDGATVATRLDPETDIPVVVRLKMTR